MVKRSFSVEKCAIIRVKRGVVPFKIAAKELSIYCSPIANKLKGKAQLNNPITAKCFHTGPNFGNSTLRHFNIAYKSKAPIATRKLAIKIGGIYSTAILMNKKLGPQQQARRKNNNELLT